MSLHNPLQVLTFEAAKDLSSDQWHFVKLDSDGKVTIPDNITNFAIGVLQNAPVTGQAAEVCTLGATRAVFGATIDEGALVSIGADGEVAADASTSYCMGICLQAADDTEVGIIYLRPMTATA